MRAAALLFAVLTVTAHAAEGALPIPNRDIDAACARMGHPDTRAYCVRQAQGQYELIRLVWDRLSSARQRSCAEKAIEWSSNAPHAYYDALSGCVQAGLAAEQRGRDQVDPPRFQRR